MLFTDGDTTTIQSKKWYILELRSERTAEEILKRVFIALESTFRGDAVEVFAPEQRTRENSFALLTENYVFVRADDPAKVARLRRVTGVQGVVSKDDSSRINSFLTVDDDYVQSLMTQVMQAYYERGSKIKEGCFVKILDGQDRDLYGHVISVSGGRACVRIDLKTKLWFSDTTIHNLLDCSDIEPRHRVFYFSPSIQKMIDEDPDHAAVLLKDDLSYDEAAVRAWLHGAGAEVAPATASRDHVSTSRERTASRFLRSLIQSGEKDVQKLLKEVVAAIRSGHIRCPQTTIILWHVIRAEMLKHAFPGEGHTTYTSLVNAHGPEFRVFPEDVKAAFPELANKERATVTEVPVEAVAGVPEWSTVTALVRCHLAAGHRDLLGVLAQVQESLRGGNLRAPKHLDSMIQAMRTQVLKYFRKTNPGWTFVDIIKAEGKGMVINFVVVRERFPDLESIIAESRLLQTNRIHKKVTESVVMAAIQPTPLPRVKVATTKTLTSV